MSTPGPRTGPGEPLAWVVRGGLAESVHTGHLLVLDGDTVVVEVGDVDAPFFARSSLKPLQALAMLRAGLDLQDRQLAIVCGSHSGTPAHVEVVHSILTGAGLAEADLRNTPTWPQDSAARSGVAAAGGGPASITQNCSGKHAGMLATCVAAGWPTASYLDSRHPLQVLIREVVTESTGVEPQETAVDGCGAPLVSSTVRGLARAFAGLVDAEPGSPEHRVATAMSAHPDMVAGPGKTDTFAMADVPGLVSKGGAEGVLAAALPGGRVVVGKVGDGSARPVPALLGRALALLGEPGERPWQHVPVLGGAEPAGALELAF